MADEEAKEKPKETRDRSNDNSIFIGLGQMQTSRNY